MKLTHLERFNEIVIQIHDNPDADAVGSGYALYRYFLSKDKKVKLIYGGKNKINKSNILLLVDELDIPLQYVKDAGNPELLITVDCQYGEGNVQLFDAQNVAVIDHHNTGKLSDDMCEIRSHLVSCATVCYALLKDANYDVNADIRVATALYYGLYMDSNQFSEISHPYDRDMMDFLRFDKGLISRLKYANLSISDFETAGIAIIRHTYVEKHRLAIINSKACDPNILGLIGDLALQVDCVDVCIVFCEYPAGYKLSVRSCTPEVAANELAIFITDEIGNGGGHIDKAGGFICGDEFLSKFEMRSIESYLFSRMEEYYNGYDVIHYHDHIMDERLFKEYVKKDILYGCVRLTDVFKPGTECKVRTLEGDVFVTCNDDTYIMIGYNGEVYPIESKVFESKYEWAEGIYDKSFEYAPSVINLAENRPYEIMDYVRPCKASNNSVILARPLEKYTKVFTRWNYETYMYGKAGDMLCVSKNDKSDIYIAKKEIFKKIYDEA